MRTMLLSMLLFVLSGTAPALAQLPPEIQADSYLLRAEQAIGEGDPARALIELDKILLLQKEHELDLPDEFHFRYAQAADSAGLPEQALDAVVKYLTGAGREGRHYVEALELMNQVQDAIEGRKESQEASHEPISSAQASSQQSVEAESEAAERKETQKEQEGLAGTGGTSEGQPESECDLRRWWEDEFFETATVQDVEACLDAGADPMALNKGGNTRLHVAARYNENPAVIEALLQAGANLNARAENKDTPLHRAAGRNENPMVIQALLAAGADPKAKGSGGDIPLRKAKRANNVNAIKVLEGTGGPPIVSTQDCRMWRTDTFFRTATIQNVKACLEEGADPKLRAISDKTPLHRAARYNEEPEVIQALLQAGADPMARMTSRETPLHVAVQYNRNPAVIEALLKAGADPMARVPWKETTLHRAARYNEEPRVIQALLAAGADPMARAGKETPLHRAAEYNRNPAVIEVLLKAGADPMARAGWKNTPLHLAAGDNENPAVIEALLEAGADPMAEDKWGLTPLFTAKYRGYPAVIKALADGAGGARSVLKWTPLHEAAAINENPAAIEALLQAGADPNVQDKDRNTPLHLAARYNENPAVTEVLLKAGADLAALNNLGLTPLALVEESPRSRAAVIQVLLAVGAGQVEGQLAAERARRKAQSGSGLLEAAIGIAGGTAIATAGGGSEEALEAGAVFAGGVIGAASPRGSTIGVPVAASTGNVGAGASGGRCEVPGYPRPPGGVANLGLAWCPASVSMQVRAFALQAAGAQCAIATGSSSTPEQIQARGREISAACGRLAALGASNCQCPPGLGGTGSSNYSSSIDPENERREQLARQQEEARKAAEREMQARQEEARQAAQREKLRIESNNAAVLNSNCSCIRIEDDGEYACLDGFVQSRNATRPLCDIKR